MTTDLLAPDAGLGFAWGGLITTAIEAGSASYQAKAQASAAKRTAEAQARIADSQARAAEAQARAQAAAVAPTGGSLGGVGISNTMLLVGGVGVVALILLLSRGRHA